MTSEPATDRSPDAGTPPARRGAAPDIAVFVLGEYQTNCFVVRPSAGARRCWIVDCGYQPDRLLDHVASEGLEPVALLLTHCHSDHIAGIAEARRRLGPLPTYVHRAEAGFCSDPALNLSAFAGMPVTAPEPEHLVEDGQTLELDGTVWRVVHTPGHSPGGVLYVHDESGQAIVGDTIFAGSIGRHDFPTSNVDDLRRSVAKVMALPDDFRLFPGHGPHTTVGAERQSNPFVIHGF
ncbi:MAG: MBL fold metallo-hydrolase [Planctomycetota bacterium]|jgi:glyoxylase-like metal-dependent hydrolase (beta-lactamase superfamily II)